MKDAVIDYGSNANGYWKKFKSGRIEQWGYKTAAGYGPHALTFPISFKSGVHFTKRSVCGLQLHRPRQLSGERNGLFDSGHH